MKSGNQNYFLTQNRKMLGYQNHARNISLDSYVLLYSSILSDTEKERKKGVMSCQKITAFVSTLVILCETQQMTAGL